MDFFDKLGEAVVSAGKDVGQKAKEVSGVAKLKIDIRSKQDYVQKQYAALGEAYYQKHKGEEGLEEAEQFYLITEALEEIDRMKEEVLKAQGASSCPNCGAAVPDDASFCASCGAKINDIYEED